MYIVPMTGISSINGTEGIQSISGIKSITENNNVNSANTGFTKIFEEAYQNAKEMQAISNQDAIDLALGNVDNLSEVMINASKSSTATQLAVDLTSRAVSVYKEILQISV